MRHLKICPICGSKSTFYLYESKDRMFNLVGNFGVWHCTSCRVAFLNPQPGISEVAKYYPATEYYAYHEPYKKGFFQKLRDYLVAHYYHPNLISRLVSAIVHNVPAIPSKVKNGRILDLGCGTGDTLILLQKLGWRVYGMEVDKKAVEIARKRGLTNIRLGKFEELRFYQDNFFDAIRLYHVIEHLNDPKLCLKLLSQKLKRGGELIIGTPNIFSIAAKLFGTFWYNLDSPRHLILFNSKTLSRMLAESGFKIAKPEFCSAGGTIGSIQYWLQEKTNLKMALIHTPLLVMLFYPLEWLLDKLHLGDVFVVRATKK